MAILFLKDHVCVGAAAQAIHIAAVRCKLYHGMDPSIFEDSISTEIDITLVFYIPRGKRLRSFERDMFHVYVPFFVFPACWR